MVSIMVWQFLLIQLIMGVTVAQYQICPDKKTYCKETETCISWERGCSLGANCLEPGIFDVFTECVRKPVKAPLVPKQSLCKQDEVFARSVDKGCAKPPCPLRLGYNCYPIKGSVPTCKGISCPFGTFCVIGESCGEICKPKATCRVGV